MQQIIFFFFRGINSIIAETRMQIIETFQTG